MQAVPDPLEIDLTVSRAHYIRSDLISSLEVITACNNPFALAVREAADEKGISYQEIYAVIDPSGLEVYFKIYQIFNGETWLLQANCSNSQEISSLLAALKNRESFSIKLNFYLIGCRNSNPPDFAEEIPWQPLLIEFSKLLLVIFMARVFYSIFGETSNIFIPIALTAMFILWSFNFFSKLVTPTE